MKNIEYLRTGAAEMAAEGQVVSLPETRFVLALAFIGIFASFDYLSYAAEVFYQRCCCGSCKRIGVQEDSNCNFSYIVISGQMFYVCL